MEDLQGLLLPSTKVTVATCNLNQWALDFDGNQARIAESIRLAKAAGAKYRIGPELEISGYSCEDHFLESDTYYHCDQSLAAILNSDLTDNILCDIGMPLLHKNVRYNCRIFCLNRKILLIRPKLYLADDGNYRERRYFTAWKEKKEGWGELQEHTLSEILRNATQQSTVPIGIAALETEETLIAAESCEELWAPNSPHVRLMLAGVEIIGNGSGSHHQLRKLQSRLSLVQNASTKCGGAYLYANQRGCDGNRLYFDGTAMICVNGDLVAQGSQFGLRDVEVISATVDLMAVRSYRNKSGSIQEQSSLSYINDMLPIIDIKSFSLRPNSTFSRILPTTPRIEPRIHTPEEECALGPACWLWDYLRRSGGSGFLLPLSGGADSASVAAIVRIMCILVATAILRDNDINVKSELFRIMKGIPLTKITTKDSLTQDSVNCVSHHLSSDITDFANEICGHILHTVYLGTENSSKVTRSRAQRLSESIGAYHNAIDIDIIVSAVLRVFSIFILDKKFPGAEKKICYSMHGGTDAEDIALQNIQARLRMVMSYLCAQLFPWVRGKKGFLLVLGSANVDESLRGYMTKYDCSSADLNPIGGISKGDLKNMMKWISQTHNIPILEEIAGAAPTAELRPIELEEKLDYLQNDEEDMGMTYAELGIFGYLRKVHQCGPVTMFVKLLEQWGNLMSPSEIAAKVKRFFFYYAINRHKMTTLTPSYHAESYSPDDNRFDLRQFLYNAQWTRQFNTIDTILSKHEKCSGENPK